MYHLELRQFPHVARVFNLTRDELEARFVRPWVGGAMIDHDDRRWAPERSRLKILEGPEPQADELGLGRGWASATRTGTDVTDAVIAQARRGAEARPEVEALKVAIGEVAGTPLGFQDVMALAAAAHPTGAPASSSSSPSRPCGRCCTKAGWSWPSAARWWRASGGSPWSSAGPRGPA